MFKANKDNRTAPLARREEKGKKKKICNWKRKYIHMKKIGILLVI